MTKIDHQRRATLDRARRDRPDALPAGRLLIAKWPTTCTYCHQPIEKGKPFMWTPYSKRCQGCPS
jgi:hypothetical protein